MNGREGEGKTTILLKIADEILSAHPEGIILWIASEGFVEDTKDKMQKLGVSNRLKIVQHPNGTYQFRFTIRSDLETIDRLLTETRKDTRILAVFVDSIRGITPYDDLDSRIKNPMMDLNGIVCDKHRASLIYIHHFKKGKDCSLLDRNTGPTSIASSVRAVFSVLPVSANVKKLVLAKANILGHVSIPLMSAQSGNTITLYETSEKTDASLVGQAEQWLIEIFGRQDTYRATDIYADGEQYGFKSGTLKEAKKHLSMDVYLENGKVGDPWMWKCKQFLQKEESLTLDKKRENAEKKPNNINERQESHESNGGISKNTESQRESGESRGTFENKNHVSHKNNSNNNKLSSKNIGNSSYIRMSEEIPEEGVPF